MNGPINMVLYVNHTHSDVMTLPIGDWQFISFIVIWGNRLGKYTYALSWRFAGSGVFNKSWS